MSSQPPCADPIAAAPFPHPPKAAAYVQIQRFLTGKGPVGVPDVPWPLNPIHVVEFFKDRIERGNVAEVESVRLPTLAEAYLLAEVVPVIRPFLRGAETTAEAVILAASLCRILAELGSTADTAFAGQYYERLTRLAAARSAIRPLTVTCAALGPVVTTASLKHLTANTITVLRSAQTTEAEIEIHDLQEYVVAGAQDIEWANEAKKRYAGLLNEKERILLLADICLERAPYGGEAILIPWSVYELRKFARRLGRDPVIQPFLATAAAVKRTRTTDPSAAFLSIRALRAALFFGGDITEEDEDFLAEHGEQQRDPLSHDMLFPHRPDPL